MLYIVATPIGNMKDITLRAIETFNMADIILAEDTRVAGSLIKNLGIDKKVFMRFDEYADQKTLDKISEYLENDKNVIFISDAGTPGISDPGAVLVAYADKMNYKYTPIPGVSALTTAMSISGIRNTEFIFYGFLPHKNSRKKILNNLLFQKKTLILYESPHRIMKLLEELKNSDFSNSIYIKINRELTKIYEEIIHGNIDYCLDYYTKNKDKIRGEFVIIISHLD